MPASRPSVAAVSYLNTVPLIWGFEHSPLRERIEMISCVPSECARRVESGAADLGLVPVAEMARLGLTAVPGLGIACRGAVRSILLLAPVAPGQIRRLAADSGSRTSVALARAILRRRWGVDPELIEMDPDPDEMLSSADAALLIGDAALRVDPESAGVPVLDLGEEWLRLTGLPMVFAQWAGRPERTAPLLAAGRARWFEESLEAGLASMDAIVERESALRSFDPALVRRYLARHIVFRVGEEEERGMAAFRAFLAEDGVPDLTRAAAVVPEGA
ncbi:MAG: menaquinone biosynthesis protein [Bryobacteraceae bacterium]